MIYLGCLLSSLVMGVVVVALPWVPALLYICFLMCFYISWFGSLADPLCLRGVLVSEFLRPAKFSRNIIAVIARLGWWRKSMDDETSAELTSFEEINHRLGEPREKLLQAFASHDEDEIDTSTLRRKSGVQYGGIIHHLETLVQWALIQELDTRRYMAHGGSDARQWTLTERGAEFIEEYLDQRVPDVTTDELAERVVDLEEEVAEITEIMVQIAVHTGMFNEKEAATLLEDDDG